MVKPPGDRQQRVPRPALQARTMEMPLVWAGFGAFICLLYGNSLSGWWAWDDSQLLKAAFQSKPWEYFFVPAVWREFQPANLNPWIILSYDVDLILFGLHPQPFYAHHLLALWMVAGTTYLLLRVWANRLWSVLGVVLFLCSAPATNTVYQLMTRHYLEGLLFFSLACYLFVRAARDERFSLSWLGAGFYFLAMSAKEIYAVQALLLPLIPVRGLPRRLRMALPFFLAVGLYALWRRYMLGTWIGGYRPSIDWAAVYPMILKAPSFIFGDGPFATPAPLIVAALIIYAAWQNPDVRILAMGALLLLLGPIIPVIYISDPNRLLLLLTWALSLAVVLTLGTMASSNYRRTIVALAVLAGVALPMAVQGWSIRDGLRSEAQGFEAHGRFVMEASQDHVLLPSAQFGNWFTDGLAWLRKNVLEEQAPLIVYDEIDLARLKRNSLRVFVFDEASRRLKEVPGGVPAICSEWRRRLRDNPISVAFDYADGVVSWQLGPYEKGEYSIIAYRRPETKVVVPRIGFKRRAMSEPLLFRVRYDSPEDWTAYSPLMQFDGKRLTTSLIPEPISGLEN
jgi:hypothetical protein